MVSELNRFTTLTPFQCLLIAVCAFPLYSMGAVGAQKQHSTKFT